MEVSTTMLNLQPPLTYQSHWPPTRGTLDDAHPFPPADIPPALRHLLLHASALMHQTGAVLGQQLIDGVQSLLLQEAETIRNSLAMCFQQRAPGCVPCYH